MHSWHGHFPRLIVAIVSNVAFVDSRCKVLLSLPHPKLHVVERRFAVDCPIHVQTKSADTITLDGSHALHSIPHCDDMPRFKHFTGGLGAVAWLFLQLVSGMPRCCMSQPRIFGISRARIFLAIVLILSVLFLCLSCPFLLCLSVARSLACTALTMLLLAASSQNRSHPMSHL